MDIHRCRFVPYPSSAINALAFSHLSNQLAKGGTPTTLRLAIGRANGDIEIWNPLKGAWYQESILRGGKDRSIEGLVWIQDPEDVDKRSYKTPGKLRLFSIGYSQAVTEWNLAAGKPLRHSAGNYGEIWCMAAQPRDLPTQQSGSRDQTDQTALEMQAQTHNIAVGCADGSIIILSTAEDDLRFDRVLARPAKKRARVLSLTFQNRHTIIAGHADSTIRIYDIRGRQQIRNMTLGGGPKGGPKETLVWTVKCISDGPIISGDSTGTISFWDSKHYALVQRIQGHEADVLDIAVSADGRSIFSGGMDRRTALYRKIEERRSAKTARWAKSAHTRVHRNDVKAMATFEAKSMSVLASGGLDTYPIITPVKEFGKEHHRTLSSLPQQPALSSAPHHRLLLSWWDRELTIWAVLGSQGQSQDQDNDRILQNVNGRKMVAKVALQGEESITSADLASDGTLLAVSTISKVKLFQLRPKDDHLKVLEIQTPAHLLRTGAKAIQLSPDRKWLLTVTSEDKIQLHRLLDQEGSATRSQCLHKMVRLERLPRESIMSKYYHGSLGNYDRSITRVAFSSDSRILVAGDLSGYLDSWVLEGFEDLMQEDDRLYSSNKSSSSDDSDSDKDEHPNVILGQHWIRNPAASLMPKLRTAPLVLSFRPSVTSPPPLAIGGNTALHPTRHNPQPHAHDLPDGEDRLLVLTAENQLLEFNVLAGKMSDWSRRNPFSMFPPEFRDLRDRAKGVTWDLQAKNERIWVYGVNWLWMFDLAQDLPPPHESRNGVGEALATAGAKQSKRKRQADDEGGSNIVRRKRDTGAGSAIAKAELTIGVGPEIKRVNGANAGDITMINLRQEDKLGSDDEDDYLSANQTALISLRRRGIADGMKMQELDGQDGDLVDSQTSNDDGLAVRPEGRRRPPYWHTYKYRPILGIVPLGGQLDADDANTTGEARDGEDESMPRGIEVALVERPEWDLDLPPRYHGEQGRDP
ncbi:MAG: hypothetical protein Q9217_001199 [Psora testacea]